MASLLCLIAHPDDELFCAGLILLLVSKGVRVQLVSMTRGEGGSLGDPPRANRDDIGAVREDELRCAANSLGIHDVRFLNYEDPVPYHGLRAPAHDGQTLVDDVSSAIENEHPDAVLTHGSNGEYGHPAHILLHTTVISALSRLGGDAPAMYSFCAANGVGDVSNAVNKSDRAHFAIDVSLFHEGMIAAFRCHRTQWTTLLGTRLENGEAYDAAIARFVRARRIERYRRQKMNSTAHEADPLSEWLGLTPSLGKVGQRLDSLRDKAYLYSLALRKRVKSHVRRMT